MPLSSGTKLGPYEIEAPLGAGGMGEVYRARDTRLGRDVALKILPESFAQDSDRLLRFEQESMAVAALNHPSILAIYDVGQHNGAPFLVTELLEGASLRLVLDRGALPQRKVIEYGVQIAQGLAAAHDKGIVHRDLKPENLFITRDGRAKILDFGLVKLASPRVSAADSATIALSHTAVGEVLGTASYMAPEQVQGKPVDGRTDIFALGAVLFEMLSAHQLFHRDTAAESMTAVLKADPPELASLRHPVSPALERIVRRCLEKNSEERFQSARDLSFALGVLSGSEISAARTAQAAAGVSRKWLWALLPLLLLLVAVAAWLAPDKMASGNKTQFAIPVPGEVSHLTLSPDGRMLAFISPDEKTGAPMLFTQIVGTQNAYELAGTEGASYPFWSPDDAFLAFFANGKLQKIAATGGTPQTLARVTFARGGNWGKRNVILYAPDPGSVIWRVNADGTNASPLTVRTRADDNSSHRWPLFLPDGNHFLYLSAVFGGNVAREYNAIYLSSLDAKQSKLIVPARSNIGYASGNLFWVDEKKSLRAAALNVDSGVLSGNVKVVVDAIGYQPSVFWGAFSVAANETVVYNKNAAASLSTLTWHDRDGKELGRVGETGVQANPAISPDGRRVAVDITDLNANNLDLWILDLIKGTSMRFTFDVAEETNGIWSRDGTTIAYRTSTAGSLINLKDASGMQPPGVLLQIARGTKFAAGFDAVDSMPNSWSPGDKQLLCSIQSTTGGVKASMLAVVPRSGGKPEPFIKGPSSETTGQISPDGKWVAYASNESGDWEIFVTTFPDALGKWQISRNGGSEPRWRGDGKEIFYLGPTGLLMSVPVDSDPTFSSRTPAPLFQVRGRAQISSSDLFTYDVTKDGNRFLVNQYVKPDQVAPLTIVQHVLSDPPK